jgi:molecular chaperone GrpE
MTIKKDQKPVETKESANAQEKHSGKRCHDCAKKESEITELTNTLQRLQAEFENYQKRTCKENEAFRTYAVEAFLKKFMPVLDSFEQAAKHVQATPENGANGPSNGDGLSLIYSQLMNILEAEGVTKLNLVGKPFDSHTAEVLLTEVSNKPGIVLDEFASGYLYHDRVLRHARVKIGVPAQDEHQANQPQQGSPP